jgi:hypothetical protein
VAPDLEICFSVSYITFIGTSGKHILWLLKLIIVVVVAVQKANFTRSKPKVISNITNHRKCFFVLDIVVNVISTVKIGTVHNITYSSCQGVSKLSLLNEISVTPFLFLLCIKLKFDNRIHTVCVLQNN